MSFQDCIDFANKHRGCYFATADGDQPRVRAMGMWFADDTGFYFQTESVKALYKQLQNNNKVEICFFAPVQGTATMMRVAGKVEFVNDMELRSKLLIDRPSIQKRTGIKGPEDPLLVLFRVYSGEAYFWIMDNNMKEAEIERIKF